MDLRVAWNADIPSLDLVADGIAGLALDEGLSSAVLISLCTYRRAADGDRVPYDGSPRGGWWGDAVVDDTGEPSGSRRWLLRREKITPDTLRRCEDYDREALGWMLRAGLASSIEITASAQGDWLVEEIAIARPAGGSETVTVSTLWAGQEAAASMEVRTNGI